MKQKFYDRFIRPISTDSDQAEREIVLNYLLIGILVLALVTLVDTTLAPIISGETLYPYRVLGMAANVLFIAGLYFIARYKHLHKMVAIILTLLMFSFGCMVSVQWGMLDPDGVLLFSLAIVMAGVLIGARYSLYFTCATFVVFVLMKYGVNSGHLHPDLNWLTTKPTNGDVISFSAILFVIAWVSWLFNRQMEMSLKRAQRSEKALQHQKDLLEIKVEKRARQLEEAQLEKMQQLYRFAELGQLSTALFHDLANHLSTVNVDIEGLKSDKHPDIMQRIQRNVGHINSIVKRVRQQIGGKNSIETFDVLNEINEVVKILTPTAEQAKVAINVVVDKSVRPSLLYKGDITRFRQVILNLICNGMEAYPNPTRRTNEHGRAVNVDVKRQQATLLVSITDYGRGIKQSEQAKIFEPFYTTKKEGVGIGLFVVRQVVGKDFNGELTLTSSKQQGTTFTISLPKSYYAKGR